MQYTHKRRYKLAGKSVSTINFSGASANYFRIVNGSACELYAGTVQVPTAILYDFRIPAHSAKMYCEQRPYKSIQIFNNSTDEAEILLFAFNAPFEASALAIADFMEGEGEKKTFNVEIGGFTQSLPSGQNHIGKVTVNTLPTELYTTLETIRDKIDTDSNIILGTDTGQTNSGRMGTIVAHIKHIDFISNDSENNLIVTFYNINGTSTDIVIKGGEVINDVDVELSKITFTSDSDNLVDYRMIYTYINE